MKRNTFLLFLLGILLVGCESKIKQQDIFANPVCQPPCWENITPGITTKQEALTILSKVDDVDQPVVDPHHPNLGFDDEIQFSLHHGKDNYVQGWIYVLDDQVSIISFENNLVTMKHAIELFGAPQSILVINTGHFDQVTLSNSQKGIAFDYKLFGAQNLESSAIEPETEIGGVTFFDLNQYQKVLDSGILSAYTLTVDQTIKNLRLWNGYGSFKEKYWPPVTP